MGTNVNAVNGAQPAQEAPKPSFGKRLGVTFAPGVAAGSIFVKELIDGKNIYEAGSTVKGDFKEVHNANKETMKKNIQNAAEKLESREWCFGLYGYLIKYLNKAVNE